MASFLSKLADSAPPDEDDAHEGDGDDAELDHDKAGHDAMKHFIMAVHSKDPEEAWEALKTAIDLCEGDEKPKGDEEDEGDEGGPHHALLLMPHAKG
jgi:hypothetical protein